VICVSDMVLAFYRDVMRVSHHKLRMIPNSIDISEFERTGSAPCADGTRNQHPEKFLFVCIARLVPQKAHEVLLSATDLLVKRGYTDFHVLIVGNGELRSPLEKLRDSLSLSEWVSFLGIRSDIHNILLSCDAFVLSSDYEGLPLSILEAMAAQLPVVATDVGGNSQVVKNKMSGYLVPSQNPDALAVAMAKVLQDPAHAKLMGQAGKRIVETEYDINVAVQATSNLFQSCLDSQPNRNDR
jgi:glycosyltransferase involved in cell wall biosynthesis